jgi:hypothetical protein
MRALKKLLLLGSAALLLLMLAPDAQVSEIDQKVIGTFNVPVMIPGQILPPGTYVFKVLNGWDTSDNVVRVWTADESRVLATALTIPRYRANPGDKEVFQFEERGDGSPQAIKAWFYPGFNYGHEFIYPKANAAATVASGMNDNAGAIPAATYTPAEESAAAAGTPEPAPVAENAPSTEQSQTPQTPAASATEELPKTASSTPLVALVSMLLLGVAIGLRAFAARWS